MRFEGQLTDADVFDMAKAAGLDMARLKRDMQPFRTFRTRSSLSSTRRAASVSSRPLAFIVSGPKGAHILGSESASLDFAREVAAARGR